MQLNGWPGVMLVNFWICVKKERNFDGSKLCKQEYTKLAVCNLFMSWMVRKRNFPNKGNAWASQRECVRRRMAFFWMIRSFPIAIEGCDAQAILQ